MKTFFESLKTIMDQWPQLADGSWVFNLDETGLTTVQKPKKVTAQKGVKQLNRCATAETGQMVTVAVMIFAARNTFTFCNDFF
jgi:hypothetical protein